MVDAEINATKGQMFKETTALFSADRYAPGKSTKAAVKKTPTKRAKKIYVCTVRTMYEMYEDDDWVHVPDSDNDETRVEEAYEHKPSSDVLANIAVREENSILKFWKKEGHDTKKAHVETIVDISCLYQALATCNGVRAIVSVELTETKLKP